MGLIKTFFLCFLLSLNSCISVKTVGKAYMLDREGLKFIRATVNDKKVLFLIDSGAITTVLDKKFCDNNGIKYSTTGNDMYGIGGKIALYRSKPLNFNILDKQVTFPVNVGELDHFVKSMEKMNLEVHGIISSDFLKFNGCIINYKTNTLECGQDK